MSTTYQPHPDRYAAMPHLRCGRAGLKLPRLALGVGCIPFSPLAQGLLTNRYLGGVPVDSRAGRAPVSLQAEARRTRAHRGHPRPVERR